MIQSVKLALNLKNLDFLGKFGILLKTKLKQNIRTNLIIQSVCLVIEGWMLKVKTNGLSYNWP
jgi:hypothetical protein